VKKGCFGRLAGMVHQQFPFDWDLFQQDLVKGGGGCSGWIRDVRGRFYDRSIQAVLGLY